MSALMLFLPFAIRDPAQPHRGSSAASIFGGEGVSDRSAPDERGQVAAGGAGLVVVESVGLIVHGDQAEQILTGGQADLIAVGREILNNPNWPMDAAPKPGADGAFRNVPPQFGWWLGTRAKRGFGTQPSTWQAGLQGGLRSGLEETRKVL